MRQVTDTKVGWPIIDNELTGGSRYFHLRASHTAISLAACEALGTNGNMESNPVSAASADDLDATSRDREACMKRRNQRSCRRSLAGTEAEENRSVDPSSDLSAARQVYSTPCACRKSLETGSRLSNLTTDEVGEGNADSSYI